MAGKGEGKAYKWIQDHRNHDGEYCLIWPFYRNPNGYGQLGYLGQSYWAHRMMCDLVNGPPPSPDHEAAHSCGNGAGGCAHPKHLSWKTKSENLLDCSEHGTQARSYHGSKGKLTDTQVDEIRTLRGKMTQSEIAIRFGVSDPTVRDILLGRTHTRPSKIKHFTAEEDAKIKEGISRGYNFRQVGEFVGRSTLAVSNRAYRMGLKSGQPPIPRRDIRGL